MLDMCEPFSSLLLSCALRPFHAAVKWILRTTMCLPANGKNNNSNSNSKFVDIIESIFIAYWMPFSYTQYMPVESGKFCKVEP